MRGKNVFAKVQSAPPSQPVVFDPTLNDLFLHALFARLAFKNNEKFEFQTKYNQNTNTIELDIPQQYLEVFDQVVGIQRGPNFKKFINWLIGSESLSGLDSNIDSKFLPTSDINIWFGATYLDIGGSTLTVALPGSLPSAINSNFKTATDYSGDITIRLKWIYLSGSNTEYQLKINATVIENTGDSYVVTREVEISTFNLINGDIRSSIIMDLPSIGPESIVDLVIYRNYVGSTDPQTELIGVIGIELEM